ncbi:MAG: peptide-methionine (R)-S-oxide reductase, partial [Saprospiraceae bacterium]
MKYLSILLVLLACNAKPNTTANAPITSPAAQTVSTTMPMPKDSLLMPPQYDQGGKLIKVEKSRDAWKKQLTADEFAVLREQGTERAGTGDLLNEHSHGTFVCAACGLPLFNSEAKFESGTGWPSFFQPLNKDYVHVGTDNSHGMTRDEVECARCGGH